MFRDKKHKDDSGGFDVSALDEDGDFAVADCGGWYPEQSANRALIIALRNSAPLLIEAAEWVLARPQFHKDGCASEKVPFHNSGCDCGLDALRERLESME